MTRTISVRVTQDHIDKGIAYESGFCPIALALIDKAEAIGILEADASVGIESFSSSFGNGLLSPAARNFVEHFDSYGAKAVQPSTFRFSLR